MDLSKKKKNRNTINVEIHQSFKRYKKYKFNKQVKCLEINQLLIYVPKRHC